MSNEGLFLVQALADFILILITFRLFGKQGLAVAIFVNLILVSIFGGKLISYFGFVTNAGNVFYAAALFAAQILVEYYGREKGYKIIGTGVFAVASFLLLGFLSIYSLSIPDTRELASAIEKIFSITPRVAFASIFAYVFAQFLNVWFYDRLRNRMAEKGLWFRSLIAVAVSQALDSVLFFGIVLAGVMAFPSLLQVMLFGFVAKMAVGILALALPFLYLARLSFFKHPGLN